MSVPATAGFAGRFRGAMSSDETLLARAQSGDAASFESFYRRHRDAVLGYCLLRLGDKQNAEDATQEVFLRAAKAPGEQIANAKAWLFALAHNVVVDAARRRAVRPVELGMEHVEETATEADFGVGDVTASVFIALRRIPSRYRRAITLREFNDCSSEVISRELGMKPAAVDVLLSRARTSFARAYAEVLELPAACRQATELIYRESGSGLAQSQRELLDAHMATCRRCAAEHSRAHSPRFLGALPPWLWYLDRFVLPTWTLPAKAAVGAAVAVVAVTSGVAGNVARQAPPAVAPPPRVETAHSTPRKATPKWHGAAGTSGADYVRDRTLEMQHQSQTQHAEAEARHETGETHAETAAHSTEHASGQPSEHTRVGSHGSTTTHSESGSDHAATSGSATGDQPSATGAEQHSGTETHGADGHDASE